MILARIAAGARFAADADGDLAGQVAQVEAVSPAQGERLAVRGEIQRIELHPKLPVGEHNGNRRGFPCGRVPEFEYRAAAQANASPSIWTKGNLAVAHR